jgi:hypothetical protein
MNAQMEDRIAAQVKSIRSQTKLLDELAAKIRTPAAEANFDKWSASAWCRVLAGDAVIRVRLLVEQNFNFIETMSLVGTARYIFELCVWLRLCSSDARYGLVYFYRLLQTQISYYNATKDQLEREIAFLKSLDDREGNLQNDLVGKIKAGILNHREHAEDLRQIAAEIDVEAARKFSPYAESASENGYGFQAHLVERKALPKYIGKLMCSRLR